MLDMQRANQLLATDLITMNKEYTKTSNTPHV